MFISGARLIFLAVMLLLVVQALFVALGSTPLGFFDGGGGE
jgi:hypothetical protein